MDPEAAARLQRQIELRVRRGWRDVIREIRDENRLAEVQGRLANGSRQLLVGLESAAEHLAREVVAGYVHAASRAGKAIDAVVPFRFDVADPDVVEWVQRTTRETVVAVAAEQEAVAQQVAGVGRARGLSDRAIAEEIQASVGLNQSQVAAVERYRRALERGDYAHARTYALADRRYDAVLSRAQASGSTLTPKQLDRMVSRYREGWQATRMDTIGITQSTRATSEGVNEAYAQAIEDEAISLPQVRRRWVTRLDGRVRDSHVFLHGQLRPFGEPFLSGDGNLLMYPGDPAASLADIVNCRCVLTMTIVDEDEQIAVEDESSGSFVAMSFAKYLAEHDGRAAFSV